MGKVIWKIRTFLLVQKCHYLWMAISGHFHAISSGSDHPRKWVDQNNLYSMLVNIEVSDGHRLPERSMHASSGNVCRTLSRWARRLILCTFVKITLQYPPMTYALLYTSMNIVRNTKRATIACAHWARYLAKRTSIVQQRLHTIRSEWHALIDCRRFIHKKIYKPPPNTGNCGRCARMI